MNRPIAIEVGLSLGSNLGDRLAALREARDSIAAIAGVELVAQSPAYETEPVDVSAAYRDLAFLNAVLILRCSLDLRDFSQRLHAVEAEMGRRRTGDRNAPRPIDIDVIYAGQRVIEDEDLRLPHPRARERRFVLQPLADVRADLLLPGEKVSVRQLLLALPGKPGVILYAARW